MCVCVCSLRLGKKYARSGMMMTRRVRRRTCILMMVWDGDMWVLEIRRI